MAATRLTATVAGCAAAAAALAALTACAPPGATTENTDNVAAQQQAPALNEVGGESLAPISTAPPVPLTTSLKAASIPKMGKVVTDQDGFVLYRFDKDTADPPASNCVDKCAQVWPPALTDGNPQLTGLSDDKVGSVTRQDGTRQLTIGGWPVYRYIGDKKPGQWKGQAVGGTWFVVDQNGKKNLTCLPTSTPKAVAPPAADSGSSDAGGSGYSY